MANHVLQAAVQNGTNPALEEEQGLTDRRLLAVRQERLGERRIAKRPVRLRKASEGDERIEQVFRIGRIAGELCGNRRCGCCFRKLRKNVQLNRRLKDLPFQRLKRKRTKIGRGQVEFWKFFHFSLQY